MANTSGLKRGGSPGRPKGVPNKATKPVPAFMKHSFNNTKSRDFDAHPVRTDRLRNGWPLGEFFDRGYGFVAVYQQDLVGHQQDLYLDTDPDDVVGIDLLVLPR